MRSPVVAAGCGDYREPALPSKPTTPATPLRVGLLADGEAATLLAAAIRSQRDMQLSAQSGVPQAAALPAVPWFDDSRVLLTQGGLDAVVLGLSPRAALERAALAASHNLHVWRIPPIARSFAEATELALRTRQTKCVHRVASWWEHVAPVVIGLGSRAADDKSAYCELLVGAAGPGLQSWRASQVDAGGGVLASDGYAMLEAFLALRGLPESVSAATARGRRRPGEAPRETEDIAAALLRYQGGGLALVRAAWDIGPAQQELWIHGADGSLHLTRTHVCVRNGGWEMLEERDLPTNTIETEMERFVAAIRAEQPIEQGELLERHIGLIAVLEAIYLSARTGQPESPRRFYEVQKWPEPTR